VRVHRRPRSAYERLEPRQPADHPEALEISGRVEGLDRQTLGRLPGERVGVGAAEVGGGGLAPGGEVRGRSGGYGASEPLSRSLSPAVRACEAAPRPATNTDTTCRDLP